MLFSEVYGSYFNVVAKVISPQSFINKLKNRINKQISCEF